MNHTRLVLLPRRGRFDWLEQWLVRRHLPRCDSLLTNLVQPDKDIQVLPFQLAPLRIGQADADFLSESFPS